MTNTEQIEAMVGRLSPEDRKTFACALTLVAFDMTSMLLDVFDISHTTEETEEAKDAEEILSSLRVSSPVAHFVALTAWGESLKNHNQRSELMRHSIRTL